MSKHLLTEIDEELKIAFCLACDTLVKIRPTYSKHHSGRTYYRCKRSYDHTIMKKKYPHKLHKKTYCENSDCGFVAKHPAQLHVDHIDGNSSNNDPNNLQTLCANCHAYKTAMNEDWMPNKASKNI